SLDRLGISTTPDETNRLAVKSDAVLFSHDDQTPGSGGMHLVLNKSTNMADALIALQNDWSSRALVGLAGDDNFTVKVSSDGAVFRDALVVDCASGRLGLNGAVAAGAALSITGKALEGLGDGGYCVKLSSTHADGANKGGA